MPKLVGSLDTKPSCRVWLCEDTLQILPTQTRVAITRGLKGVTNSDLYVDDELLIIVRAWPQFRPVPRDALGHERPDWVGLGIWRNDSGAELDFERGIGTYRDEQGDLHADSCARWAHHHGYHRYQPAGERTPCKRVTEVEILYPMKGEVRNTILALVKCRSCGVARQQTVGGSISDGFDVGDFWDWHDAQEGHQGHQDHEDHEDHESEATRDLSDPPMLPGGREFRLDGLPNHQDVRCLLSQLRAAWPSMIIEDDTGILPETAIRELPEQLFIYRDEAAYTSWGEHGGTPDNADSMVHLRFGEKCLTAVATDPWTQTGQLVSSALLELSRDRSLTDAGRRKTNSSG